jgi:putative CocE/NonD family hydrolase
MTPHKEVKTKKDVDESTDTFDTIDWLIRNIKNNNGNVGQWGISYPGFYASAGTLAQHPALKASSPQAPMADLRRDDAFHNGAFMLAANFGFYNFFQEHKQPTKTNLSPLFQYEGYDGYRFYLGMGALKNAEEAFYKHRNVYFTENFDHPDYDEHWKARNILPHLKNIKHAVMIVGGWYDMEDLYGTFKTYQAIEKQNPGTYNIFVIGPWVHGGWASANSETLGDVKFGQNTSPYFQEKIETKFFRHYLIDPSQPLDLAEATIFETGTNQWRTFDTYPPKNVEERKLYFHPGGKLSFNAPVSDNSYSQFYSDPAHPVPSSPKINSGFSRSDIVEDQRFAHQRPDVLTFETDILTEDITISGNILPKLKVSVTGTDADWVVKVIDVYPADAHPDRSKPGVVYAGYEQLVRSDIFRSKYRNDPSKPEALVPDQITEINFELQDVLHTFRKGHRIMIQVQSSCFPWADRNPQTFTDIFKAGESDYKAAFHRLYHNGTQGSFLVVNVLK